MFSIKPNDQLIATVGKDSVCYSKKKSYSNGAVATTTFEAVGESVSCVWSGTAWTLIAYGTGAATNDIVGTQDNT